MMDVRRLSAASAALVLLLASTPAEAIDLTSDGGYLFDIQDTYNGGCSNGTSDAYDGCYGLSVNGVGYSAGSAGTLDGRYVTMATITMGTDLSVTRHAYVPATGGDYIRYYDVIENTGASSATVDISYACNFGSDSSTVVWGTYSGDTTVDVDDYWFGTDDADGSGDPSLAHAYFGDGAIYTPESQSIGSGDSTTSFSLTIGPGEVVGFIVFGFQGPNEAEVRSQVEDLAYDIAPYTDDMDGGDLSTIVNWGLSGAPLIRWTPGQTFEVAEGGELEISLTVEDREGDDYTIAWDLDNDGEFDDGDTETVTFSAAGLDGPDVKTISVRATDTEGNVAERHLDITILNAPPTLSSPTEVEVMIGEELTYTPTVSDPGGDEVEIEVLDRPSGMILLADGGVRWTPLEEDVGDHVLTFVATDDDDDPDVEGDGDAVLVVTITVVANQPPGEPTIVSPERGTDVTDVRPTLVIENPTDPEGDLLFISFEVAETDTYSDAITSGPMPAGTEGTTSWTVTEDLENHKQYYWRVWASDENGAESLRSFSYFRVEVSGDETDGGVDAGDLDGGTEEARIRGCGCGAANGPSGSAGVAVLILFVGLVMARIRRS